jgi:hypothetical protein
VLIAYSFSSTTTRSFISGWMATHLRLAGAVEADRRVLAGGCLHFELEARRALNRLWLTLSGC